MASFASVTGHEVGSFAACPRQFWFSNRGIRMEPFSELVADGKLLSEKAYAYRAKRLRQIQIGRIKVDLYDPKRRLVYEIKRAPRLLSAHRMQLLFYLYYLEKLGFPDAKGYLVYPRHRKKILVELTPSAREELIRLLEALQQVRHQPKPPPLQRKSFCRKCAYYDLCWIREPLTPHSSKESP
ncbi:MAG: CRISPR-associated protein Cas4 [Bacteroidia bacterium]|nr:CRISPR-associated protein Cas4 [Bacteroidia bacterium]